MAVEPRHCLVDRCSAPVSSSRRFTHTGSATRAAAAEQVAGDALPDLGDHRVGERDQVPFVDRDLRIRQRGADPGRVRRRRVDHHDLDRCPGTPRICSPSQSRTQPPVRPGANPSSDPGPSREQSTKLVSHGSDRFQVMPSKIQRTERNRVSSIPSLLVGAGSGSHLAAADDERLVRGRPRHAVLARPHRRPPGCSTRSPSPPDAAAAR